MRPVRIVDGAGVSHRLSIARWSRCGKQAYASRKLAKAAAKVSSRITGELIEAYHCWSPCHAWHIGHPPAPFDRARPEAEPEGAASIVRAIPIPDGMAEAAGGRRVAIGEPDPTRDDVRPCEYIVTASGLYPGRPAVSALVELDDDDRAGIAAGGRLVLTMDGGELPWQISVVPS